MSKSKNNGVDPQELIDRYGADTARLFVMFACPPEQTLEWNDAGVEGASRFLRRLWAFGVKRARRDASARPPADATPRPRGALRREMHLLLRQVSYDYERMQYNTVVSRCDEDAQCARGVAPTARRRPARCARACGCCCARCTRPARTSPGCCGSELGFAAELGDLLDAPWPQVDEAALVQDEIELVLQVNGKMRGACAWRRQAERAAIEAAALASPDFAKFAEGRRAEEDHRRARAAGECRRLSPCRGAGLLLAGCRRCCWPAAASSCKRVADAAVRQHRADRLRAALAAGPGAARSAGAQHQREGGAGAGRRWCCRRWARSAPRRAVAFTASGQVRDIQLRTMLPLPRADAGRARADPRLEDRADPRDDLHRSRRRWARNRKSRTCSARCSPTSCCRSCCGCRPIRL